MYETRQRAALQDENKRGELKAAGGGKGVAGNGKAPTGPINNRRALGDIGNLVGAAAVRSNVAKDGLAEGQNAEKKAIPVDRPVTRSFGAQLASNQTSEEEPLEPTEEEEKAAIDVDDVATWGNKQKRTVKKQDVVSVAERPTEPKSCDSKASNEIPPGHPARMKALLNGRNGRAVRGKERRGRTLTATLTARSEAACGGFKPDKIEESVSNIDAADVGDQLAVVDYIEDIYSFYRKTEAQSCVPPDYMSNQTHINDTMRSILVDWLIEVHLKFKLMPETLFLTTNVIDRYLAIQSVERKHLQLVGMTAMLLAAKYEEIWAPEIQDFIFISDNAYTGKQILDMEKVMLNTLKFNFCVPTPYVFMVRFLKAASSDQQMNMLAFYFVELCLVDYKMVKYSPSMLAAAAVYTAQCTTKGSEACWNATLKRHSGYSQAQLIECASEIVALREKAGEGSLTVVQRKYSHAKFGSVALLSPPNLLPTAEDSGGSNNVK